MYIIYQCGVVGKYTENLIAHFFENVSILIDRLLSNIGASSFIKDLVLQGMFGGMSSVLGFIPQLTILFLCISFLESTGYMARIAMLFDRFFRRLGMSGKSIISFMLGLGCSVPGIMSSKIIENEKERKMTSIVTPFIPCSAKLPMISLFSSYFFHEHSGIVAVSFYFLSVVVMIISSFLLKKIFFSHSSSTYISELPRYQFPQVKYMLDDVLENVKSFIIRAGSMILISSILVWLLLSFSLEFQYGVPIEESILAQVGSKISFLLIPVIGKNSWEITISAIQGLIAKEQVISSFAVIQEVSGTNLFSYFTPISAYAFVVFHLFSAPCIAAVSAMKHELGGTLKTIVAILFQTLLAWCLASGINITGTWLSQGNIKLIDMSIIGVIFLIGIWIMCQKTHSNACKNCKNCQTCHMKSEQIVNE